MDYKGKQLFFFFFFFDKLWCQTFSLSNEIIIGNLEVCLGIKVRVHNTNKLRYADVTVFNAGNKEDLLVNIKKKEAERRVVLKQQKTEVMVVS